ncbi:MAG: fumarate hydratase C-terminal domain-containing protein [Clostridia bacterium]|nr:fumarate hydratase C-terminal domain-containing protein [Clostridia bacterium]
MKKLVAPFEKAELKTLNAGDFVLISGKILTGRDAAHKRMVEGLKDGRLPFDVNGQTIFYVGPCFKDGKITACGPTTSMRMNAYAPTLFDSGVVATIGKGNVGSEVYDSIKKNGCVYFAAIGGAGATYGKAVKSFETVAYEDLGTEAVYSFEVQDFPAIVAIDARGNSIFEK